ncbi:hypothetical protein PQU92_00885 [Asticcacaulis sp. BYS171W]|uniref:Uncharacterized protein n=1 Tax=Asticcacaulis aquaticus TaxID=2984212 RepID=A0ABT5HP22_9CAUL|nr:hypothetical protein [Asticcacaulis aquaticus]MDC7681812.1 hypothetical protein [Asticcacaulis aquaticus]
MFPLDGLECNDCKEWQVDVFGDGRVIYQGYRDVSVLGCHEYRIPTEQAVKLIRAARLNVKPNKEVSYGPVLGVWDLQFVGLRDKGVESFVNFTKEPFYNASGKVVYETPDTIWALKKQILVTTGAQSLISADIQTASLLKTAHRSHGRGAFESGIKPTEASAL